MLTNIDMKILREIVLQGFTDYSSLAKRLRISPSTVLYSIRKMRARGHILGFRVRLNPLALGFSCHALFMLEPKLAKESYEIMDLCHSRDSTYKSLVLTGPYSVAEFSMFRSYRRFGEGMRDIISDLGPRLDAFTTIPVVDILKLHNTKVVRKTSVPLTSKETEILRYLLVNPLAGPSEISRELGMSRTTVSKALSKFYEYQVVLKRSVIVSRETLDALGYRDWALVFIDIPEESREKSISYLVSSPDVHELYELSSYYDLLAIARGENVASIARMLRKMFTDGIALKTDTRIILKFKEKDALEMKSLFGT